MDGSLKNAPDLFYCMYLGKIFGTINSNTYPVDIFINKVF